MSELPGADFAAKIEAFEKKLQQYQKDIFAGVVAETKNSITDGSPLTGAPGQPVDTGNLKGSWQAAFESAWVAIVGTNVKYAPAVEAGIQSPYQRKVRRLRFGLGHVYGQIVPRAMHFKNHGPHSVKLTRANFGRIVESVVKKVVGNA